MRALIVVLVSALLPLSLTAAAAEVENRPVNELDLQRYSGTWHEIARLPMFFQRKCVSDTTATYTPNDDGTITVVNQCRREDGSLMTAVGAARPTGEAAGALEVRFAPRWLSWLPLVWGDYWVVALDPSYRWVIVGGPNRDALWMLARDASIDADLYDRLKAMAAARGYPVGELIVSGGVH